VTRFVDAKLKLTVLAAKTQIARVFLNDLIAISRAR
jgi:hypothetical protein